MQHWQKGNCMSDIAARQTMTDRTTVAIREALGSGHIGLRSCLLFAGPAVIASIAYMDPGNFATNIQAGARHGYMLLWVVLLANLVAMLFQALSARLGIVTGHSLATLCRLYFPRPRSDGLQAPPRTFVAAAIVGDNAG